MDKMREEFEAWFWNEFHKDSDVELYWSSVFATTVNGDYRGMACYAYWTVWKASREALCVELPKQYAPDSIGSAYCVDAVIDSLDSAGVRYK